MVGFLKDALLIFFDKNIFLNILEISFVVFWFFTIFIIKTLLKKLFLVFCLLDIFIIKVLS